MASSSQTISTYIICGNNKWCTEKFNHQSNMAQIHEEVRCLSGLYLPWWQCLKVYNPEIKNFIKLDQNQLDHGFNPFKSNQHSTVYVDLYVIDIIDEILENNTQSSIYQTNSNNSGDLSTAGITDTESQENLPINSTAINDGGCHGEVLSYALLNKDTIGTNTTIIYDNNVDINEFLLGAWSTDNLSDLNFPLDGGIDTAIEDLIDAIPTPAPSVELGDAMPPQNNSSILNPDFNMPQTSIGINQTQNIESTRLQFSLDVKSEHKVAYRSDQINQKDDTKTNGYIPRVQGIKNPGEKMSSVWPKVRIPGWARNIPDVELLVYVVSERLQNGKYFWIKHRDKGFLPNGFTRDTLPINPMVFHLNPNLLTLDGDFKLDLQMVTMWVKSQPVEEIVYKPDEQSTIRLHPAIHDPSSPRLLCVLRQGGQINWETFCLSDFIRSTKQPKRCLPDTNTTVQINQSAYKKARSQ